MSEHYKVTIPGSLMLLGEHAVLHGSHALVMAVDKRISLELRLRQDAQINISSNLGELHTDLTGVLDINITSPWEYVLTAIQSHIKQRQQERQTLGTGFDLIIQSEFSHAIGFGSSAAVTVGVLALLYLAWQNTSQEPLQLLKISREVVRKVQGTGSGADLAASVFGGIVLYKMAPLTAERIEKFMPLVAVYSGSKMPTKEVVALVKQLQAKYPKLFMQVITAIDHCVLKGVSALKSNDLQCFGEIMNLHHGLQVALGTSNLVLEELIFELRKISGIYGAKISGSGLGDCVIGCGEIDTNYFPQNKRQQQQGVEQITVNVSGQGILYCSHSNARLGG